MLIVLNLVIIIFVLGMALLWATYGFFSGFLQLVIVIASGVIALAVWEPLTYFLLARMPAYAHGVGLLAPFALCIILLRIPLDKYCKMNLNMPHLANQIGGGVCGAVAGILAFGMLLNGANYLPIERTAMGWEPYTIQGTDVVDNPEGQLWAFTRVNEFSAGFFEFLSAGAMSPTGGTALAEARPGLAEAAMRFRVPTDTNASRVAHPDSVQIAGVYAVPATAAGVNALIERIAIVAYLAPAYKTPDEVNYGESGMGLVNALKRDLAKRFDDPKEHGKPSAMLNVGLITDTNRKLELGVRSPASEEGFEQFLSAVTKKLKDTLLKNEAGEPNAFASALGEGNQLWVIDTEWNKETPGAYDSDDKLRVDMTQVRLQVKAGGETQMVAPTGYSIEYNQNNKARTFTELKTNQIYRAFSPDPDFHLGWAFILPEGQEPIRFFVRELRFDLTKLETPDGADSSVNANFGAVARVLGVPRLAVQTDDPDGGGNNTNPGGTPDVNTDEKFEGPTQVGTSGGTAQISEQLPATYGGAGATGLDHNKETEPWTLFKGKMERVQKGRGGTRSTVREVSVGQGFRLVRIQMDSRQAQSLYGAARGAARSVEPMRVTAEDGNAYQATGFVLDRGGDFLHIDIRGDGAAAGGLHASELPNFGQGETMYVYFEVPVGKKIVDCSVGNGVEAFEQPLTVVEKSRRRR